MKHYKRVTYKFETRNELHNHYINYWWDWDYYDDVNYFRSYDGDDGVEYEYLDGGTYYSKQIDMMSIYSKEMLRHKKIDMILDDIQDLSNTIQNIIKSK